MRCFTSGFGALVLEVKLCKRGVDAARRKYKKYPSAYANGYAVQVCKGMQPDNSGVRRKSFKEDLDEWFREKWVDIGSKVGGKHPECGRDSAVDSGRAYPKCVPSVKAAAMSSSDKKDAVRRKRSGGQGGGKSPKYVRT